MKKDKSILIVTIAVLFIFLINSISIYSLDIALTPGAVNFGSVLREGFAQGSFTFSTYSETPIIVRVYNVDKNNMMDQWIYMHLSNGTEIKINDVLLLDKNHPLKIFVTFEPSSDAPNGDYQTTVGATIEEGPNNINIEEGGTVARIKTGLSVKLTGKIEDVETLSCQASNMVINNPEIGEPITIASRIKNTGNIYLNPKIEVQIWDSQKTRLIKSFEGNLGLIKPTISSDTQFDIDSGEFAPGKYMASVYLRQCNLENKLMSFEILDIGSKTSDGRIRYVSIPSIIYGYKPTSIKVTFENIGEDDTVARAYCEIYKDNVMIYPLISDSVRVTKKESIDIPLGYFTPSQTRYAEDRYVLKCRVHYGTKDTPEYTKVFFVKPEEKTSNLNLALIIGMTLIILILLIVVAARKRK